MPGHLRVPLCFLTRSPYGKDLPKFDLFSGEKIKKNWSVLPLLFVQACAIIAIPLVACHRVFFTMIDVPIAEYYRFEIPSVPRFFDLRNPRTLKLMKFRDWTPAIHLDNRYRLMRGEPMLDADGKETDQIGEDPCAPPSPQQAMEIMKEKGEDYFAPKIVI